MGEGWLNLGSIPHPGGKRRQGGRGTVSRHLRPWDCYTRHQITMSSSLQLIVPEFLRVLGRQCWISCSPRLQVSCRLVQGCSAGASGAPTQGTSGHVSGHLWLSSLGGGDYRHPVRRGQGCAKHPTVRRAAPRQRRAPPSVPAVLRWRRSVGEADTS